MLNLSFLKRKNPLDSDQELLAKLRVGDQQAVKKWFLQYHQKLLRFVLSKVSSEHDAEEIVQEVFINCLKHLPLFRGRSNILTWMKGIARHEVADYYRKKYAKRAIKTLPLGDIILSSPIEDSHETSAKVRLVVAQMSWEYRELLLLKYVDKKKVKDIAVQLDRTAKAVESDLFRARREFRCLWLRTNPQYIK